MRKVIIILCLGLSWLVLNQLTVLAAMTSGNGYTIWADVISTGGGEDAVSNNYQLSDTIGENALSANSDTYSGSFGFRGSSGGVDVLSLSVDTGSINLGTLSTTASKTASHSLTVETNSASGVSVTAAGSSLTNGSRTITAIGGTAVSAVVGTNQFGFNLVYSGGSSPVAVAVSPYDDGSKYAFSSGAEIISSVGAINATTFSVTYLANIDSTIEAGTYTANITYTATANF